MARVTTVERAQQRYHTKPVIDPETGEQKKTPVLRRDGSQKTTKRGTPVFMKVTERDLDRPKPLLSCDYPGCDINGGKIAIGTPYKWIKPKSGPYGGTQRNRHKQHPSWQVWEYSNSLSARLAQISHDFSTAIDSAESTDDVQSALDDAASSVEEIADEKDEGASNIEDGFGHETSASEELKQVAEELRDWAQEISSADIPEVPECETCGGDGREECSVCSGDGTVENGEPCEECNGNGDIECTECDGSGEDLERFREEVADQVTIVDESPV